MNPFDTLKKKVFRVVTNTMGYDATWLSSVLGSSELAARVGFYDPTEKQELSGIDSWNPDEPFMEYFAGDFPGLKELVDEGTAQFVTIAEKGYFSVRAVNTKFDGDTFVARLVVEEAP